MLNTASIQEPSIGSTTAGIRLLQCILALPFVLITVGIVITAISRLASIVIEGQLGMLIDFLALSAAGAVSGSLALSLLRGRGVPLWFLRGFWIVSSIGLVSFGCYFAWLGFVENVDPVVIISCVGSIAMTCITWFSKSAFNMFWNPFGK